MELPTKNMQVTIAPIHQEQISASEQAIVKVAAELKTTSLSSEKRLPADQVNISEEARQKSIDDKNQAAMRKMLGKEEVDETKNEGQKTLDEQIAELQEKIAKLTTDIAQERRSGNDEKAKTMESELAMLNAQLLQLIEQKMETAKT